MGEGDCCGEGGGGVYLIDSFWYWVHPAGTFAESPDSSLTWIPKILHGADRGLNSCGKVFPNFLDMSDYHKSMHGSQLKESKDLTSWYYGAKAYYMGPLDCGSSACSSNRPDRNFTKSELAAMPANSENCFIAMYLGSQCGEDGGVYQISKDWVNGHSGGPLDKACGTVVTNFLEIQPNFHKSEVTSLRNQRDLGGIPAKATYVGSLDCNA